MDYIKLVLWFAQGEEKITLSGVWSAEQQIIEHCRVLMLNTFITNCSSCDHVKSWSET